MLTKSLWTIAAITGSPFQRRRFGIISQKRIGGSNVLGMIQFGRSESEFSGKTFVTRKDIKYALAHGKHGQDDSAYSKG